MFFSTGWPNGSTGRRSRPLYLAATSCMPPAGTAKPSRRMSRLLNPFRMRGTSTCPPKWLRGSRRNFSDAMRLVERAQSIADDARKLPNRSPTIGHTVSAICAAMSSPGGNHRRILIERRTGANHCSASGSMRPRPNATAQGPIRVPDYRGSGSHFGSWPHVVDVMECRGPWRSLG
jgi:hypothetical protein